jgi:hypothetical protein
MKHVKVKRGERMPFILQLKNGYNVPVPVDKEHEAVIGYGFAKKGEVLGGVKSDLSLSRAIDRRIIRMEVIIPDQPGTYQLKFCVFAGILFPTHNSQTVTVVVE